jgi:thymidylate synthase
MNTLDKQYTDLLATILEHGVEKKDRTGTGTRSIFGYIIRHNMKDGFPLLTTKKMPFKTIVTELLWFLRGDTNIKFLVDNNCHIWDGDAYKNYVNTPFNLGGPKGKGDVADYELVRDITSYVDLTQEEFIERIKTDDEFAKKWGDLGPVYGKQWRNWGSKTVKSVHDVTTFMRKNGEIIKEDSIMAVHNRKIDQIQNLINDLKTNPDSRRLMVNAWNVADLGQMVLPPCHYGFQVYTRELSLEERLKIANNNHNWKSDVKLEYERGIDCNLNALCNIHNIPTRAISLMWNQRSVDTFLGLPFNIASYGLLLEIIAKEVNMVPDQLIGNLGDVHLYSNHIEQAKEQIGRKYTHEERTELLKQAMGEENYNKAVDELMPFGGGLSEYYESYKIPYETREPFELPELGYDWFVENWTTEEAKKARSDSFDAYIRNLRITDFIISGYKSHPAIKAPLSN